MQHDVQPAKVNRVRSVPADAALALAIAVGLSIAWAIGDLDHLRWLLLPDTDDMARLAQVRDWLGGQAFNDWTQYRLGPAGGAPMHWSRINDIGIAALILAARPFVGTTMAEIFAVAAYPAMLFAAYLFLAARTARRLWRAAAAGPVAIVLAALAYPADAAFLPGRIDHHALQIVCLAATLFALAGPATWRRGMAAGVALGVSLGIGLETLPQTVAIVATLGLMWVRSGHGQRARLAGLGAGLGTTTLLLLAAMRPTLWSDTYCDGFTPASTSAMLAGAGFLLLNAGITPRLRSIRSRLLVGCVGAAIVTGAVLWRYPSCVTGPYGRMDPFLRHAMIDNITEALPVIGARHWTESLALFAVILIACPAAVWAWRRYPMRRERLAPVVATVLASGAVALVQARGATLGAAFAPLILAGMVVAARRRATPWPALGAWAIACGITWLAVPPAIARGFAAVTGAHAALPSAPSKGRASCRTGPAFAAIDRLPEGSIMAAIDLSAYLLGATDHRVVGAGYHRNNLGNRALYAFFLSPPKRSLAIAHRWPVDYVAFCPGDFAELGVPDRYADSLAAMLARGDRPDWLEPVPLPDTPLRFYRIR